MEVEGWSPRVDQYVKKGVSFGIIPDETADHNGIWTHSLSGRWVGREETQVSNAQIAKGQQIIMQRLQKSKCSSALFMKWLWQYK